MCTHAKDSLRAAPSSPLDTFARGERPSRRGRRRRRRLRARWRASAAIGPRHRGRRRPGLATESASCTCSTVRLVDRRGQCHCAVVIAPRSTPRPSSSCSPTCSSCSRRLDVIVGRNWVRASGMGAALAGDPDVLLAALLTCRTAPDAAVARTCPAAGGRPRPASRRVRRDAAGPDAAGAARRRPSGAWLELVADGLSNPAIAERLVPVPLHGRVAPQARVRQAGDPQPGRRWSAIGRQARDWPARRPRPGPAEDPDREGGDRRPAAVPPVDDRSQAPAFLEARPCREHPAPSSGHQGIARSVSDRQLANRCVADLVEPGEVVHVRRQEGHPDDRCRGDLLGRGLRGALPRGRPPAAKSARFA